MIKAAVLDLYNETPNQGMKGLIKLLENFRHSLEFKIFKVRSLNEIPSLDFDVYISTGGPGNPHFIQESANPAWGFAWNNLMLSILKHNKNPDNPKKFVFLICHSFQMMCILLKVAKVELRYSTSFGIFPMHKTKDGELEEWFLGLEDPFYSVDSRDYQVLDPDKDKMRKEKMKILAYEKIRAHVPFDRAIMSIRFSPEILGTQFHPEADPENMLRFFKTKEKKDSVVKEFGETKYLDMLESINNPDRITKTYSLIIPRFLEEASKLINSIRV
jgi:homoserine O-succinyltransferase